MSAPEASNLKTSNVMTGLAADAAEPSSGPAPTLGWFVGPTHRLPVRVYYEDTDFTGVVYHANYLRFMERGRSEMLRLMGERPDAPPIGVFAVVRITLDFRAPARIHDALVIDTEFVALQGPRLVFRQQVRRGGDLLCAGEVTAVALNPQGRARRPSAAEIAHWTAFRTRAT